MARRGRRRSSDGAAGARGLLCGPYNGSAAMLRPLVDAAHAVTPLGVVLADAELVRQRAQPPPRARTARGSKRDPGQAGQGDVASSRLSGQDAQRLPTSVIPTKAGAGRERLLSSKTQALVKSTGPKPRNAANAGTAAGAGLQPVPAQTLPGLKSTQPALSKDVNRAI